MRRRGENVNILDAGTRFTAMTALALDATLSLLSEPIHRGSLANARGAIEARRADETAARVGWSTFTEQLPPVAALHRSAERRRVLT
jgi:hypothetical protein